jgi:hypothetical protein
MSSPICEGRADLATLGAAMARALALTLAACGSDDRRAGGPSGLELELERSTEAKWRRVFFQAVHLPVDAFQPFPPPLSVNTPEPAEAGPAGPEASDPGGSASSSPGERAISRPSDPALVLEADAGRSLTRSPGTCELCGPLPAPWLHSICHPVPGLSLGGCGHGLEDHSPGLKCRVCGAECGIGPPRIPRSAPKPARSKRARAKRAQLRLPFAGDPLELELGLEGDG